MRLLIKARAAPTPGLSPPARETPPKVLRKQAPKQNPKTGQAKPVAPADHKPELPAQQVRYTHPATGREHVGRVSAAGPRGVTVLDEAGQAHPVPHGHYVAHNPKADEHAAQQGKEGPARPAPKDGPTPPGKGRGKAAPVDPNPDEPPAKDQNRDAAQKLLAWALAHREQIARFKTWQARQAGDDATQHQPANAKRMAEIAHEEPEEFLEHYGPLRAAFERDGERALGKPGDAETKPASKKSDQKDTRGAKGEEVDWSNPPPLSRLRGKQVVLYHGTSSTFADDIERDGLVPPKDQKSDGARSNPGRSALRHSTHEGVFLTARKAGPNSAAFYARGAAARHGGEPTVYRVVVDGDALEYDPDGDNSAAGRYQFSVEKVAPEQIQDRDGEKIQEAK